MAFSNPKTASLDTPVCYGAAQLFAERARQVRHGFSLKHEWNDVVRICNLLDGMPLGIELAAAWVKVLSCAEIAQEIERNLDFLVTSYPAAPNRHRSLRAVFEHSWQLLSLAEQRALARLSVFQGGFTREAAAQVADVTLFTLSSLVNKSLVWRSHQGRYELHQLWQQYAAEQLKLDEQSAVYERHAEFYGRFLHHQEHLLSGQHAARAIADIRVNIQNIRAGWQWVVRQRNSQLLAQYIITLHDFYATLNWYQEGSIALNQAWQALTDSAPPASQHLAKRNLLLAQIMARQAEFQYECGNLDTAQILLHESLAAIQHHNDPGEKIFVYRLSGIIFYHQGQYQQAQQYLQQGLELDQAHSVSSRTANICLLLGAIRYALGDYENAWMWYKKSLHIYQTIKKAWGIAHAYRSLGCVAQALGHYHEAKDQYQQSLSLFEELENPIGITLCMNHLGVILQESGDLVQAQECFFSQGRIYPCPTNSYF